MRHNVLVRRIFFDEANKDVGLFGWALVKATFQLTFAGCTGDLICLSLTAKSKSS